MEDSGAEKSTRLKYSDLVIACSILVASALLKIAYFDFLAGGEFSRLVFPDESNYYLPAAQGLIDQGFGWFLEPRSLWTGPLNPLWITVFGANIVAVKLANLALWVGSGLLLFDIGRRLAGRRAGLLAVGFYSVSPPFFVFTPTLLTEPLFVPLLVLWLWLVVIGRERRGSSLIYALSGVALGLATLTRPTTQLLPLFLLAIVASIAVVRRFKRCPASHVSMPWKPMLLMLVGVLAVVAPYLAKNVIALDKPGIANGLGAVLYLGNDLRKHGDEPIYSSMNFDTSEITTPYTHLDTEGDARLIDAALDEVRQRPVDVAFLQVRKALRLMFGSPDHYFWPYPDAISYVEAVGSRATFNLWDMAFTAFLVIFGVIGMGVIPLGLLPRVVLSGAAAYFALVHTALFPIPRMIMPILPILALFAAGCLSRLSKRSALIGGVVVLGVVSVISFQGRLFPEYGVSDRYRSYFDDVALAEVGDPVATNSLTLSSDGLQANGRDPFLVYDVADFDARVNQVVFIELGADSPPGGTSEGTGQVFWADDDEPFSNERSSWFTIRFGTTLIYAVSPSFGDHWNGEISSLRIDFPDDVDGAHYEIIGVQVRK